MVSAIGAAPLDQVPEGIIECAVSNAEEFARERGCTKVTRSSIVEQMEEIGMDLDQMRAELCYLLCEKWKIKLFNT